MRSRYAAFALGEREYLLQTWHADSRPHHLQPDPSIRWLGLEILAAGETGSGAWVEFEASLLAAGQVSAMRERSEFVLENGRWLYTKGSELQPGFAPWRPGRNQPCPCGSTLKFKRCCATP